MVATTDKQYRHKANYNSFNDTRTKNKCEVRYIEMKNSDEDLHNDKTKDNSLDNTGTDIEGPDGGWGWLITFAAFIVTFIWTIPASCFGILFSTFMLEAESPAIMAFITLNLTLFTGSFAGYMFHPMEKEYGWRMVTFVCGILLGVGLILSAFAPSPPFLLFSFSVVTACAIRILHFVSITVIQHYFTRWRALANSIVITGSSLCDIAMPPVISLMQGEYGFRGAALILGAISFNVCVAAMVFHPLEWHYKAQDVALISKEKINSIKDREPGGLKRIFTTARDSLKVFKVPSDAIVSVILVISYIITANVVNFVPFAFHEEGFTVWEAALCLSAFGWSSFITKILTGLFSYCPKLKIRFVMAFGELMSGLSILVFTVSKTFIGKLGTLAMFGCGIGLSLSMYSLFIVEVLGLHKLASTFSVKSFLLGIVGLFLGPILGAIHLVGNNYKAVFYFGASCYIISAILCLILPAVFRLEQQRATANVTTLLQSEAQQYHDQLEIVQLDQIDNQKHQQFKQINEKSPLRLKY